MITEKERLMAQSEVVKGCAKHIGNKVKKLKKRLVQEKDDVRKYGGFEDTDDFYKDIVKETEIKIETLIEEKISLEKYAKLLKHQSNEIMENKLKESL